MLLQFISRQKAHIATLPLSGIRAGSAMIVAATVAAGITLPAAALAGDRIIGFDVGLGAQYAPEYEGSGDYTVSPSGTFSLKQLQFGSLNFDGTGESTGFSISPSLRYIAKRESSDFPELAGIPDNDLAIELGFRASYDWEGYGVFGQVRKGVTGHHGLAGEIGADVKYDLSDKTSISFGPRMAFGDDKYMSYAFDVPATATALAAYDASGGTKSYGAELKIRHELNDRTFLEGLVAWERYDGDAAMSPIVQAGDRDQVRIGVNLIRRFQLRF